MNRPLPNVPVDEQGLRQLEIWLRNRFRGFVRSVAKRGSKQLQGNVTFSGSGSITLTEAQQNIDINAPVNPIVPVVPKSPPAPVVESTIAADGKYNAFPWVVVNGSGDLIAVFREDTTSTHTHLGAKIVMQRSTDGGHNWLAKQTVATPPSSHGYGTCGLVCIVPSGRLILGFFEYDGSGVTGVYRVTSDDGGATWSTRAAVSAFSLWNATNGGMFETTSSRLIWPIYGRNTGDTGDRARVLISDDQGDTWTAGSYVTTQNSNQNEMTFVQFSNGTIRAYIRQDGTDPVDVYVSESTDDGDTWTVPTSLGWSVYPGLITGLLFPESQALMVFFRQHTTAACVFRYSFDQGASWSAEQTYQANVQVYAGGMATSPSLVGVAVAFENGTNRADVRYTSYSVTGSSPSVPDATGHADGEVLGVDTGAPAWETVGGDVSGPITALALAVTGVSAGTYGDATHAAQVTVDAKGRVTAASSVAISAPTTWSVLTNPAVPDLIFAGGDVIMVKS